MTWLVAGVLMFLGMHSISILGLRDGAVARLGEGPWKGLYSIVSLVAFVMLVWGYGEARTEPTLVWAPPVWTRHLALTILIPAFPLLFAAYLPGRISRAVGHPMVLATILWAGAHLLANGMLHDLVLFGGFLVWGVVDFVSLRARPVRPIARAPETAFNDVIAVLLGLGAYGAFIGGVHAWLFGVAPI